MYFREWIDSTGDESDDLGLFDAWRAGVTAMFDQLTDLMDELNEDGYKDLKERMRPLMEGNNE